MGTAFPTGMSTTLGTSGALAGGASSPVRSGWAVGGEPYVQVRGAGAYAYDASGRRSIDYVMAYGPLLFGHGHPAFSAGLDALAARGAVTGSTHPDEVLLAERIRGHLPSMERLRFATTGSEAVQGAIRVARAFTQRDLVLKFAGNYHGHFDLALQDAGASAHTADAAALRAFRPRSRTISRVARYNDLADVDAAARARRRPARRDPGRADRRQHGARASGARVSRRSAGARRTRAARC